MRNAVLENKEIESMGIKKTGLKYLIIPFSLTIFIITADQITKAIINNILKIGEKIKVLGDFFWIWHVRNKGMAFSMGDNLPYYVKDIFFILLPIIVLAVLTFYYFRSKDITNVQRWCFTGILGGGIGNLIDRIIRPQGVVDFLSVKFYGMLGLDRWPTFNLADSTIVIAGLILLLYFVINEIKSKKNKNKGSHTT